MDKTKSRPAKARDKTHFWNWDENEETGVRTLFLDGTIADESWWDDEITPKMFKDELVSGDGDIVVWINSPGGDCVAASQIYAILVGVGNIIDVQVLGQAGVLRTAVIFFYLSNEGVSLLENAGHLGLPIPAKLKAVLEQLHDRSEKEDK